MYLSDDMRGSFWISWAGTKWSIWLKRRFKFLAVYFRVSNRRTIDKPDKLNEFELATFEHMEVENNAWISLKTPKSPAYDAPYHS